MPVIDENYPLTIYTLQYIFDVLAWSLIILFKTLIHYSWRHMNLCWTVVYQKECITTCLLHLLLPLLYSIRHNKMDLPNHWNCMHILLCSCSSFSTEVNSATLISSSPLLKCIKPREDLISEPEMPKSSTFFAFSLWSEYTYPLSYSLLPISSKKVPYLHSLCLPLNFSSENKESETKLSPTEDTIWH